MISSWQFFSHETDIGILKQTLHNLYGIRLDELSSPKSLDDILECVLELCRKLEASDERFFNIIRRKMDTHLLDYLVTDALFHLRKDCFRGQAHSSLNQFLSAASPRYSANSIDFSNFNGLTKQGFMTSLYPMLTGVHPNVANCNYSIPKFMDRLLFLLIMTIRKSPFRYRTSTVQSSFSTLNTFFIKGDLHAKAWSIYEDDLGNRCIASYLVNRLFDLDTISYIANRLNNPQSSLKPETVVSHLEPIFFVPNTFGKQAYCDLLFDVLASKRAIDTRFDHFNQPLGTIAYEPQTKSPLEIEAANLTSCNQYLLFLATIYFPVLNACFYVLLNKAYPESKDADAELVKYLEQQDYQTQHKQMDQVRKKTLQNFSAQEKRCFSQIYAQIINTLSDEQRRQEWIRRTSLNYIYPDSPHQAAILETVMKEKIRGYSRKTAKFITF